MSSFTKCVTNIQPTEYVVYKTSAQDEVEGGGRTEHMSQVLFFFFCCFSFWAGMAGRSVQEQREDAVADGCSMHCLMYSNELCTYPAQAAIILLSPASLNLDMPGTTTKTPEKNSLLGRHLFPSLRLYLFHRRTAEEATHRS